MGTSKFSSLQVMRDVKESAELVKDLNGSKEIMSSLSDYLSLKISNLEDEKEYESMTEKWRLVREERLRIDKVHKQAKKPFVQYGKAIDDLYKKNVSALKPAEEWLRGQMLRVEKHKEEQKRQQWKEAHEAMIEAGYVFHSDSYICGSIIIDKQEFSDKHTDGKQMAYWIETGKEMAAVVAKQLQDQSRVLLDDKPSAGDTLVENQKAEQIPVDRIGQPTQEREPVRYPNNSDFGYEIMSYNKGLFDAARYVQKKGLSDLAKEILQLRKQ